MSTNYQYKYESVVQPTKMTEHQWPNDIQPLVSISCITYNHVNFIRDAIEGFLMQETTFPMEILIHDDASTDGTTEIIREYEAKYPRLFHCFYETENTWNKPNRHEIWKPFREARRGKYIALCEGDDYWTDPLKLQKQVEFLEENEGYIGCFHNAWNLYDEGRKEPHNVWSDPLTITVKDLALKNYIATNTFVFRNHQPKPEPLTRPVKAGDYALFFHLATIGKIQYFPELMSVYRIHEGGIWSKMNHNDMVKEGIKIMKILDKSYNYKYHQYFKIGIKKRSEMYSTKSVIRLAIKKYRNYLKILLRKKYI